MLIRITAAVLTCCTVLSCADDSAVMEELDWAEAVMEEHPDSALALLDTLDRSRLTTREARARHALLYSQALDKNYIELTTDSVISPAVKYYKKHGSPDYRLKTQYYLGCIFNNAGDRERAMEHYVEAEKYVDRATDWQAIGRLYSAKRTIYFDIYDFEKSYRDALLSAEYYSKSGDIPLMVKAMTNAAYCAYFLDNYRTADSLLNEVRDKYWDTASISNKSTYFSSSLYLAVKTDSSAVKGILNEYLQTVTEPEEIDWSAVANIYRMSGNLDSALWALEHYPLAYPDYETEPQYLLLSSLIYEELGQFDKAYASLKKYSDIVGDEDIDKFEADTKFIEERYRHESEAIRHHNTVILIISGSVIALLLAAIILSNLRNKAKIAEITIAHERQEAEKKQQYLEDINTRLTEEKDALTDMLSKVSIPEEARRSVNDMLTTVTRILSAKASGSDSEVIDQVTHKMEQLTEDRNQFVLSVMLSYATAHPEFTTTLKARGLSEWETGYCCLYAMGLRGKDIGNLIGGGSHAHHNRASAIRAKLGLTEHDTTLGRWLIRLANETDHHGQNRAM